MYKVFTTLDILSATTSASDFTVNNHNLRVLPLTSMLLHTVPWFYALVHEDSSIRNVLELEHCFCGVPYYNFLHLGRY